MSENKKIVKKYSWLFFWVYDKISMYYKNKNKIMENKNTHPSINPDLIKQISDLSSKVDNLNINQNLENTEIKKYINNFVSLKEDINILLKTKNPIGFILQIKKIKDSFFIHIENLIDFVEKEFQTLNTTDTKKHQLLYNLWFQKLILELDTKKYLLDSKFFHEMLYFEAYAIWDKDFKHFVQKIISIKNIEGILKLKNDLKYSKYSDFIDFIYENKINFSRLKNEKNFWNHIVKQIVENNNWNRKKLLNEFYSFFKISNLDNAKYSKLIKLNNKLNYSLDDYETNLKKESIDFINNLVNSTNIFNFDFYIKIFEYIKTETDTKTRGYLWLFVREKIKEIFQIKNNLNFSSFVWEKFREEEWIEKRLNYRVVLRNDESKQDTYKLMDGFNQFRNIILNIQNAYFSDFYKIYILNILTEKLTLKKEVYNNFKFFMLFVLPKNYVEYCKIYTFFMEYEQFKKSPEKTYFKLGILSILWIIAWIYSLAFYVSWILALGILLFMIWKTLKENNFLRIKSNVRFHFWLNAFWLWIIIFYWFMLLSNNWFFQIKVSYLEKLNNHQIVWQKMDETPVYKNTWYYITSILNYKNLDK